MQTLKPTVRSFFCQNGAALPTMTDEYSPILRCHKLGISRWLRKELANGGLKGTCYCTYTYKSINGATCLTYFEDTGSKEPLSDPLSMDAFEILKRISEGES